MSRSSGTRTPNLLIRIAVPAAVGVAIGLLVDGCFALGLAVGVLLAGIERRLALRWGQRVPAESVSSGDDSPLSRDSVRVVAAHDLLSSSSAAVDDSGPRDRLAERLADLVDGCTELLDSSDNRRVETVVGLAELVDGLLGFVGSTAHAARGALELLDVHSGTPSVDGSSEGSGSAGRSGPAEPVTLAGCINGINERLDSIERRLYDLSRVQPPRAYVSGGGGASGPFTVT